jgi:eukaryotic-like serine/threonine-protein kinase
VLESAARSSTSRGSARPSPSLAVSKRPYLPRIVSERYRLLRQIGGGGMGKVFEAEIIRTGLRVAVKMLHPLMAQDEEARIRLARECELVHEVDHDALVPILDIDEDEDDTPYVVMELLRGEDLRERLDADKYLSIRDAVWIAWHVADALGSVHEANVVHRDLKPENIFLQRQRHVPMRVRILDFGIAKARERLTYESITLTKDGRALGTPAYMSPEQARGDRNIDARTDIYALAVVLYEMLTGQSPYPGGDEAGPLYLLQIIRERDPIPLRQLRPDASRSLEFLLSCALEKSRESRLHSMDEFMTALSAIAAEPIPGAPVTDLEWGDEPRGAQASRKDRASSAGPIPSASPSRPAKPEAKRRKTTR